MPLWSGLYVTDADILAECVADYPTLVPGHQRLAAGRDGAVAAGSFDLTAGSISDWAARGVEGLCVVAIHGGKSSNADHADILIVDETYASGPSLTLRRVGLATGQGHPPGESAGLAAASFEIPTCKRQVETNQRQLLERYRIADAATVATPADFRTAIVYGVLCDLYAAQYRAGSSPIGGGGSSSEDNFAAKYRLYRAEYDAAVLILDGLYGLPGASGRRPAFGLMPEGCTARRLRRLP